MTDQRHSLAARRTAGIASTAALLLALVPSLGRAQHEGHGGHEGHEGHAPQRQTRAAAPSPARDSLAARAITAPTVGADSSVQRVTRNGVSVEFSIRPARDDSSSSSSAAAATAGPVLELQDAVVRLKLSDSATGRPLAGLEPAAWIDRRASAQPTLGGSCKAKVDGYVQAATYMEGSLKPRANVDLTSYFVLSLNKSPDITVIDPFLGFGRTKLYTTVRLKRPGEDWKLTGDQHRLFVSMPTANAVAIVNTDDWKVLANVDAGVSPTRLALQPDERFVWVTNETTGADPARARGGVTVIDVAKQAVAATITTGAGPHTIAFSDDGALAFVANERAGTVTVIDARKLTKVGDVRTGVRPVDVTYSPVGGAAYVVNEGDGTVAVVDGRALRVVRRLQLAPGVRTIRFPPTLASGHEGHMSHMSHMEGEDGSAARLGFVLNPRANTVTILDARSNGILRTTQVQGAPDQVAFTSSFAYVRQSGTPKVALISLDDPSATGVGRLDEFEAGRVAPVDAGAASRLDAVVPAPDMPDAVYVLNPKEKMIYYFHYMEGMALPSGGLTTYGYDPRAVMVAGKDLRETEPGVYSATVKLTERGMYDLVFLLDAPRVEQCFPVSVVANPAARKNQVSVDIKPVAAQTAFQVGPNVLRFLVSDIYTNKGQAGLRDVSVLANSPNGWQQRAAARPIGDGVYEVALTIPEAGPYYLSFEIPSVGLRLNDRPPLIVQASRPGAAPAEAAARTSTPP